MTEISLNDVQKKAAEYINGPSLIIAGAGTGKTRVLTEKIKNLVLNHAVVPANILALTFTEKAAAEMEKRIDISLPYGYTETWIMTFHSFADRILRENGMHIGVSPTYRLLTGVDSDLFFKAHLHEFPISYFNSIGNPTGFISGALTHFSRLREEYISPEEYESFTQKKTKLAQTDEEKEESDKLSELSHIYTTYVNVKRKENVLDFSDLLYYCVELLSRRKHILNRIQKQFKYCLVDEFQDTNMVQYELIKLLFPPSKKTNLTVIGDDNQSIYKFRGASISNILYFKRDYVNAKTFVLTVNYRSYQEILNSAYSLIEHNNPDTLEVTLGISKKLIASRGTIKNNPQLLYAHTGIEEAVYVVKKIKNLIESSKYTYADVAILVRANDHAKPFIQEFEQNGIPYQFLGPGLLYNRSEVRDLISLLHFIRNVHDSINLYRVLSMPIFQLNHVDLIQLTSFAKRIGRSLFEALFIIRSKLEIGYEKYIPLINDASKKNIINIYDLLCAIVEQSHQASALHVLFSFLEQSGYLKKLTIIQSEADEQKLQNITRFFYKIKKMDGEQGEPSVAEVTDSILLSQELGDSPPREDPDVGENNAVNILTAHSAKGLEFPVVFLVNCVVDRFPTRRRDDALPIPNELIKERLPIGDVHIQEERRLFYVGITRAKDELYFSAAEQYTDGKRIRKLSPFIYESLGEQVVKKVISSTTSNVSQLSIFDITHQKKKIASLKSKNKTPIINTFSFTQLETFEKCPLQYKYRYILKIPEPESSALSFGTSIHKALEVFYRKNLQGEEAGEKQLLQSFREHFIPVGYGSRYERENAFSHGEELLKSYLRLFHSQRGKTIQLEYPFTIKVLLEHGLASITGKIDRISQKGKKLEIIDYKTGKMPKESELKKSFQLGIYALAAMEENVLGVQKENLTLTFYYLDELKKFTLNAEDRDLEKVQEHMVNTITEIKESTFSPTKGFHCTWCPFKKICPAWDTVSL